MQDVSVAMLSLGAQIPHAKMSTGTVLNIYIHSGNKLGGLAVMIPWGHGRARGY